MEDLLKDPEYNRESLEDLIPNLPRKELKGWFGQRDRETQRLIVAFTL